MRTASAELLAHLDGETTTIARLLRIVRADGTIFTFTDAVRPIVFDAGSGEETYESDTSFTSSAVFTSKSLAAAQSVMLKVPLVEGAIEEADLLAGLFKSAAAEIMLINYESPADGVLKIFSGTFGRVRFSNKSVAEIELKPDSTQASGATIGKEAYSSTCRANLGDSRCGFDLEGNKVSFTVDAVSGADVTASELSQADNHWSLGFVKWLTGNNAGTTTMIATSDQSSTLISLAQTTARAIQVGDTADAYMGCDKQAETCRDRFNRMAFMRAEPLVPGPDIITRVGVTVVTTIKKYMPGGFM